MLKALKVDDSRKIKENVSLQGSHIIVYNLQWNCICFPTSPSNHLGNVLFAFAKRHVQCMQNWGEQLGECLFTLSPAIVSEWSLEHL